MEPRHLRAALAFHRGEREDELSYRALASASRDPAVARLLDEIAATEARHAEFWAGVLTRRGESPPAVRAPRWRIAWLRGLLRLGGPAAALSAVEMGEAAAYERYHAFLHEAELQEEERAQLRRIIEDELEHEAAFREQGAGGARMRNLRDFVLGMNDGLVEILGSVSGLAAAFPGRLGLVAVSGFVVGIAGALSMAIGAFVSVRSQRQVDEAARRRLRILFSVSPRRTREELARRLRELGVPAARAEALAEELPAGEEAAEALLGEAAEDSEWRSALFTGLAYLLGTAFPLLPYALLSTPRQAFVGSIVASGLALAAVGGGVALASGISLRRKVVELVGAGLGAAAVAYGFGRLLQWWTGVDAGL